MPRPMPSLVFCACANLLAALVFTDPAMAQTGTLGTEYQATHYPSWQGASALSPYGVHNMHFALPVVRYLQEHEDQSLWLYECDKDSSESLGPILDWKSNRDSIMAAYDGSDVVAFIWRELNQLYVKVVDMGNGDVLLNTLYVSYWDSGGHHIVHTGSGNFMIVYGEGPSIDRSVLRARSLTWNGSAYVLGEAKTVDNVTGKPSAYPRLMRLSAGKTVCSYQKADGTPGNDPQAWDWDIKMRVLNADGSPSSAGEYSIAATTRREVQARIAGSYSTGHGLVVWEDVDGSGEYDIMRASFIANPSDGSISLPPEDWMESESNVKEWMPDVAYDHNARKYLVVYAREQSAGNNDILGKEVSLDGSTSPAQLICSSGANQLQPSVAYNGIHDEIGNTCVSFLVTWNDYRNGQECVYARSYALPLPNRTVQFYSDGASEVPISLSPEDWNGDRNGTTPFSRLYLDGTTVSVSAPASIGGEAQDQWMYFSHWSDGYNDYSYRSFDFDVDGGDYTFTFYYLANRVPNKPTLSSPPNRATGQPLTPTLSASAFSDPDSGDSHSCSHWQVDNNSGFASPEWESEEDFDHRTQVAVPAGRLAHDTTYYWRVRYRDARMGWSEWSDAWWFKTDMSPLASIEITGPTEVNEGAGAQYACTAWYSDGSSADVTASTTWSEDSAYATISGGGYLSAGSVSSDQPCRITASYGGKSDVHDLTIKNVPATLSSIEITGPTEVNEETGAQYACTAWYSDGSSADVTASATWSENSAYATISGAGYLSAGSVSSDQPCRITATYGGKSDTHDVTIKNVTATIAVSASPAMGGTVSGGGIFSLSSQRTVTANANSGYSFVNWTEGGNTVSTTANYTFTITADRTLVANFSRPSLLAWGANWDGQCDIPAEARSGVSAFAGGQGFTLALKNGKVLAWGDNFDSQCQVPTEAQASVTAISAGWDHALALKNGRVLAWGDNGAGACNVPVEAQSGVTAISGGGWHSVALKNGKVLAWGFNLSGQCNVPSEAQSGVTAIAAGVRHTVALKNGRVLAWGFNGSGECNVPTEAQSGVTAIAAGWDYTIALKGGKVLAWGYNATGGCNVPADAQSGVTAIAAGDETTVALKNGRVLAWGDNTSDQCNVPVEAQSDVITIEAGAAHVLAMRMILTGEPWPVPGTVEMENFNLGGPGVAYSDTTAVNEGGQYRPSDGVDIARDPGAGNSHAVGWTKAGEWLEYTVNVVSSGTYAAEVGVAAVGAGGQFRMLFNGIDKTGLMAVPNTGAWNAYQVVQKTGVALSSGIQTVRVEMVTTGASGNVGAFDWFRVGTFVPSLAINPASLELPKEASSGHQIAVVANVPWVATRGANSPWITISSGTNHGSGNISFSISANNEAAGRQGNILVTGSGIVRTCMVTQVGTAVAYGGVVESIVAPSSLAAGQMCMVTSTVRNTGTNRWTAAVAGSSAYPSYRVIFRNMSWTNSADQTIKQVMSDVEPGATHALGSTVDVSRLPPGRYSYVVECKYHASASSESYVTMGNSPRTNTLTIMAPPLPLPGRIEAEDFNYGEPGMAYSDATPLNEGGQYRPSEGVDISGDAGAGNGHVVGWTKAGEWLEYTVNVVSSGVYDLEARVAGVGTGGQFLIRFNGVDKTGGVTVPNTGAWTTYQTVQKTNVSLSSGIQTVRVEMVATGTSGNVGAFDWFKVVVPPPGGQQPANAGYYPWPATDWVEFEDYDRGGEGVAYGDTTATNQGGVYRTGEGVDIAADSAASNGYSVGWTPAGEWLEYTALVPSNGMYDLEMRVANSGAGAICRMFVDGADVTGPLSIPNTGAWNVYQMVRTNGLKLRVGVSVFRFELNRASSAGAAGAFDCWRLIPAGPLFGISQALAPSGTSRILGWDLYTNRIRIQHRPSLTTGEWAPVTGWITGQQYAVPASGMGTSGFYRIEYQP